MTTKEEFDASCNFEPSVSVSREPVDDYEISQHSADEVIYPKADMNLINDCDDPIFNIVLKRAINPSNAMNITNMLRCAGVTHPKDDERQVAIDEALDFFAMMDAPSPEQLGVLYDVGYRLTKES